VPRYEAVIDVGDLGVAVLQEQAVGHPPKTVTAGLVERLVELAEIRQGVLADTRFADGR
jgi:hypothetical protein